MNRETLKAIARLNRLRNDLIVEAQEDEERADYYGTQGAGHAPSADCARAESVRKLEDARAIDAIVALTIGPDVCPDCLGLGFLHMNDPHEIQACDHVGQVSDDDAARAAHRDLCGCDWPEIEVPVGDEHSDAIDGDNNDDEPHDDRPDGSGPCAEGCDGTGHSGPCY